MLLSGDTYTLLYSASCLHQLAFYRVAFLLLFQMLSMGKHWG